MFNRKLFIKDNYQKNKASSLTKKLYLFYSKFQNQVRLQNKKSNDKVSKGFKNAALWLSQYYDG